MDRGAIKKIKSHLKNKRKRKGVKKTNQTKYVFDNQPKTSDPVFGAIVHKMNSQLGVWDLALCEMLKMLKF